MTLIESLRVGLAYTFYKVNIYETHQWENEQVLYKFEFIPRKVNLLLFAIVCSPFHVLLFGVISLFKTKIWKVERLSTYFVIIPKGRNVAKLEMYKKY